MFASVGVVSPEHMNAYSPVAVEMWRTIAQSIERLMDYDRRMKVTIGNKSHHLLRKKARSVA